MEPQPIRQIPVVGVEKCQPVAARCAGAGIAGGRHAAVGLPDQLYGFAVAARDERRVVAEPSSTTMISCAGQLCAQDRIDRARQRRRRVIARE